MLGAGWEMETPQRAHEGQTFQVEMVPRQLGGDLEDATRHHMRDFVNKTMYGDGSIPALLANGGEGGPLLLSAPLAAEELDHTFDLCIHKCQGRYRRRVARERYYLYWLFPSAASFVPLTFIFVPPAAAWWYCRDIISAVSCAERKYFSYEINIVCV